MKPPICEVCDNRFDRGGGELVSFVVDEATRSYDLAAEQPGFVGHRPNSGWFCAEHVPPARARSGSMTLADAVRAIAGGSGFRKTIAAEGAPTPLLSDPTGGADPWPVEPVPVEIGSVDDHGEPMRGPFIPSPDERLRAETAPSVVPIAPRVARDASAILYLAIAGIGRALGVEHLRNPGSISSRDDPAEAPFMSIPAQRCATTIHSFHGRDLALFAISARYVDDAIGFGEIVHGEHARLLVQQQQTSILEVVATSGGMAKVALDGQQLLDQAQVRVSPTYESRLEGVIAELVNELGVVPFDPFELGPDLAGVDLRGGTIRRSGTDRSTIEWPLAPVAVSEVRERFLELVPALFDDLGLGSMPELERIGRRTWAPMDGSVAPNCPYVDYLEFSHRDAGDRVVVSVHSDQAHWHDNDIANVSAGFRIDLNDVEVSAYAAGSGSQDACTVLSLGRPTSATVIDALVATFESLIQR